MRFLHGAVGLVTVVAGPLLLTGAGEGPDTEAPVAPTRCYGGAVYESIAGYPDAHQLLQAHLRLARWTLDDLRERAPQLTDDPHFPSTIGRAQGAVEAFTALSDLTRNDPRPPLDQTLRAVDEDGELIASVTFSTTFAEEQGTYALGSATLPDLSRDPAHGCGPRSAT